MTFQVKYLNNPHLRGVISGVRVGRMGEWYPELYFQAELLPVFVRVMPLDEAWSEA